MKQNPRLQQIQENMQPGSLSAEGFMGNDSRSLSDILRADQAAVDKLGLTHGKIAERMRYFTEAGKPGLGRPVRVNGIYEVTVEDYRGVIPCPFQDSVNMKKRNTCTRNVETGEKLCWTDLSIHMISAHGFYEGKGSSFRVDPGEIGRFLRLI